MEPVALELIAPGQVVCPGAINSWVINSTVYSGVVIAYVDMPTDKNLQTP